MACKRFARGLEIACERLAENEASEMLLKLGLKVVCECEVASRVSLA